MAADAIADRVDRLFVEFGYRDGDGWTFWLAIAAIDAGLLAAGDVGRTVDARRNLQRPPRNAPGWFRTTLAQKAGIDCGELTQRFDRIAIDWGDQPRGHPPAKRAPSKLATTVFKPPERPRAQSAQSILAQLVRSSTREELASLKL